MSSTDSFHDTLTLDAANIGGINETSVELSNEVTVLEGKNATNRTSFLQAVMAAMGSDHFNLKGDANHGRVRLTLGDTVVEREFNSRNGVVDANGEGYLDDPELADLFAFLLEENEARRAVARGDDLREIIIRPIDTDKINAEIERLQAEKRQVDEKLEHIEERERKLVDFEQRKTRLETNIEERRARLEELEAEIDKADTDLKTEQEEQAKVKEQLNELKERRSQLDDIRFQIETTTETIDSLQAEWEEKTAARDDLTVDPDCDVATLRSELDKLREQKRHVNAQVSELQSIIQFNEDMLNGTDSEIATVLRDETVEDDRALTDQLLESDESVVCWTCGSQVSREDIDTTLERLRSFRQEKLSDRQSIQSEIEDTKETVSELEQSQHKLENINQRLAEIESEINHKRSRIEDLEVRREEVHDEIDALEQAVEQEQKSDYSELLDLHKQANAAELKLEQKEDALASVEEEIAEIESLLTAYDEYEQRREQIDKQLKELRNRIGQLEKNAVEEFNSRMEDVLDILEYDNIARIWIERLERETQQGRCKVTESHFELHIIRESDSGQTYEGTVDTLSESEREVVGLVFTLAGYLVHDLHKTVPVMLLDSLEAIDADRIARLVAYFAEYPNFLIVALLPEDANAIEIDNETVTHI